MAKFKIAINSENPTQSASEGYYSWHTADYSSIEAYLDCYDWQSLICSNPSAISMWAAFTSVLHSAIDMFVPHYWPTINNTARPKCRKRHTTEMRRLRSSKLKLWHKLKSHPYDSHIRAKYRACISEWRDNTQRQELQAEERLIESNNLGAFFRHVNKRVTHRSSVSVIITDNGDVLADDKEKADAFNKYYASVGVVDNNITRVMEHNVVLDSLDINEADVLFAINKLKNNLSCGPDGLPPIFFGNESTVLPLP